MKIRIAVTLVVLVNLIITAIAKFYWIGKDFMTLKTILMALITLIWNSNFIILDNDTRSPIG